MPDEQEQAKKAVRFDLSVDRDKVIDLQFTVKPSADLTELAKMVFDWFSRNQE